MPNKLEAPDHPAPILNHNLDPSKFMWLWAKYVREPNLEHHCTHALRGPYSKKLSRHNPDLIHTPQLILDEEPIESYQAIYICGVARQGYQKKENYPHNLHAALILSPGATDTFTFESWHLTATHARFLPIPTESDLPRDLQALPPEYTTCRIFRFAASMHS